MGSTGKSVDPILEPGSRRISIGSKDPKLYPPGNSQRLVRRLLAVSHIYIYHLLYYILHITYVCTVCMKLHEKGCGCVFRRVSGSFHLENVPALWSKSANSLNTKKVPNKCGMEQSVKGH